MTTRTTRSLAGLTIGVLATGAMLLGTGTALADDDDSLSRSTCSWAQIDAAFGAEDPVLARLIDGHPEMIERLERRYALPPQDRRESFIQIVSQRRDIQDRLEQIRRDNPPGTEPVHAKFDRVSDTCHNF